MGSVSGVGHRGSEYGVVGSGAMARVDKLWG